MKNSPRASEQGQLGGGDGRRLRGVSCRVQDPDDAGVGIRAAEKIAVGEPEAVRPFAQLHVEDRPRAANGARDFPLELLRCEIEVGAPNAPGRLQHDATGTRGDRRAHVLGDWNVLGIEDVDGQRFCDATRSDPVRANCGWLPRAVCRFSGWADSTNPDCGPRTSR